MKNILIFTYYGLGSTSATNTALAEILDFCSRNRFDVALNYIFKEVLIMFDDPVVASYIKLSLNDVKTIKYISFEIFDDHVAVYDGFGKIIYDR